VHQLGHKNGKSSGSEQSCSGYSLSKIPCLKGKKRKNEYAFSRIKTLNIDYHCNKFNKPIFPYWKGGKNKMQLVPLNKMNK
jgi:hypothetical protein